MPTSEVNMHPLPVKFEQIISRQIGMRGRSDRALCADSGSPSTTSVSKTKTGKTV